MVHIYIYGQLANIAFLSTKAVTSQLKSGSWPIVLEDLKSPIPDDKC